MAFVNNAKCFRKAALCHIQQNEYAQASALIRRCPGTDAPTFYVAFLAAAHQGKSPADWVRPSNSVNSQCRDPR